MFTVIERDPLGRILSALASLLLHLRCCIYAVHFVAHTLHLCFALTPSSLEGLPPFELCNFVRLLHGALLHSLFDVPGSLLFLARCSCLTLAWLLLGACTGSRNTHGVYEDLLYLDLILIIPEPSLPFSPELEVAEAAGSSPEARNFGQPVLLDASPFAKVSSAGSSCRSGSRLERVQLNELILHDHHFRRREDDLPVKITTSVVY